MEEQVITATTSGTAAPVSPALVHDQADLPDLEGKSSEDLAAMLDNPGGGPTAPKPAPEVKPEVASLEGALDEPKSLGEGRTPEVAPVEAPKFDIPEKFQNADGTPNLEALIKSQADGQSYASQVKNELTESQKQHAEIQATNKAMQDEYQQWQEQKEADSPEAKAEREADPAKMAEYNEKKITAAVDKRFADAEKKHQGDMEVNAAANRARQELPMFAKFEKDIQKMLGDNDMPYSKQSLEIGYNAVVGQQMPQLLKEAKNGAYSEGYAKAKAELGKHVESGGKASSPADGLGFSKDQINDLKEEELRALLPNHDI